MPLCQKIQFSIKLMTITLRSKMKYTAKKPPTTHPSHHIVKEVLDKLELYNEPRREAPQDVEQELNVIGVVP